MLGGTSHPDTHQKSGQPPLSTTSCFRFGAELRPWMGVVVHPAPPALKVGVWGAGAGGRIVGGLWAFWGVLLLPRGPCTQGMSFLGAFVWGGHSAKGCGSSCGCPELGMVPQPPPQKLRGDTQSLPKPRVPPAMGGIGVPPGLALCFPHPLQNTRQEGLVRGAPINSAPQNLAAGAGGAEMWGCVGHGRGGDSAAPILSTSSWPRYKRRRSVGVRSSERTAAPSSTSGHPTAPQVRGSSAQGELRHGHSLGHGHRHGQGRQKGGHIQGHPRALGWEARSPAVPPCHGQPPPVANSPTDVLPPWTLPLVPSPWCHPQALCPPRQAYHAPKRNASPAGSTLCQETLPSGGLVLRVCMLWALCALFLMREGESGAPCIDREVSKGSESRSKGSASSMPYPHPES